MPNDLEYKILNLDPESHIDDAILTGELEKGYYIIDTINYVTYTNYNTNGSANLSGSSDNVSASLSGNIYGSVNQNFTNRIKYILCTTPAHKLLYD